jgi:hypothetical protein
MNYYLLQEHWSSIVRKFKDEEREDRRNAEDAAMFVLDYIRYTKLRQYNMFTQKRGEEFERMIEQAEQKGYSAELLRRFMEDDERWQTTLEFADQ